MAHRLALSDLGRRTTEPPISWLMKTALEHPGMVSLAAGFTDNETLPVLEVRDLVARLLRTPRLARPALQYGSTAGDPALRELTANLVRDLDGPAAGPAGNYTAARTIITHGSQQLLYLITEALCNPGDIVLVEDPTYFVYLGIAQSHGLRCRAVRMDAHGFDPEHLAEVLAEIHRAGEAGRVKLFYSVSCLQNPTGRTVSLARKQAALRLLRAFERRAGYPVYFLEDAAYRSLRFAGADVPSALAVPGAAERVIYTGTYSKPFATGIRVGYGLLPRALFDVVTRIKGNHDFGTAHLLQKLLARAVATGAYDRQVATLRRRYAQKARTMDQAMARHFPAEIRPALPEGGLYFWVTLPPELRSGMKSRLFREARKQGVLYVPGGLCYADDPARKKPDHEMRLSYGNATETDIRKGIARLGAVLARLMSGDQ